ncbi:MAG: FAD-dependent oxidoreductase [Pseudomonadota bacterium]
MAIVEVTSEGRLAWVRIDHPPVNATSTAVRQALLDAVGRLAGHDLAILSCAGPTFIAGGDMSEFDRPPELPHLPDVVQAIEESSVPFLALLHGNVLGGGLEIAMACAFRIAAAGTRFGLPEVNVGLIPGAGGTQRAPRLFGWEASVDMACSGKLLDAETALELGAIDAIADDLEAAARAHRSERPQAVSRRDAPALDRDWLEAARGRIVGHAKGAGAPLANLEALAWATRPFAESQPKERARHLEMRQSDESVALRHIFFAERAVAKPAALGDARPRPVERVAIVGGGLMGAGIAGACLAAGLDVAIIERDAAAADAAEGRVRALIDGALKRGKIDAAGYAAQCAALTTHDSYGGAAGADLAIEAVFEDVAVKQAAFSELAQVLPQEAILATNTSYLDPRDIFDGIPHPDRCIGLHFFSPAHIMRLLEVIRLPETAPETLATGFALAKRLKKVAVLSGICDGFIGNRMLAAYRRAAEYMLADGALPQEVDQAMRAWGMAMGPFEAQDMAGLQIAEANRRRQDATRDPAERYVPISDRLCAAGRYGQRTGRGWYRYVEGSKTPAPDAEVTAMIEAYSAEAGITRRRFAAEDIQTQLLAILANEGAGIVEEGIAESDAAVDVVKVHGYGFPRWRGGPLHAASRLGDPAIREALDALEAASPGAWHRAQRYT